MKIFKRYHAIIALVAPLLLAACADNDVYNPDKVRPVPPVENPLGEDFVAPTGFDWSMITTVKLNIEVKDEFNGMYNYLAEVFTTNPLTDATATPIAADYAKAGKNYVVEISIPKSTEHLYIRQTDPKQRKTVYQYDIPENGSTLNCKLYYTTTGSRALGVIGTMGWSKITVGEYNEEQETDISGLVENPVFENYSDTQLKNGSVYVIKQGETFNGLLTTKDNNQATVIVKGTWNLTSDKEVQGLDIYITDGGKLSGSPIIGKNSTLEIQKSSSVDSENFTTKVFVPVKNFGTLKVSGSTKFNTNSTLYNARNAAVEVADFDFGQARIEVTNYGSFSVRNVLRNNSGVIYNAEGATFNIAEYIKITSTMVLNHGKLDVGGTIETNNNMSAIIANYSTGTITADKIEGGGLVINDNLIEVNTYITDKYNTSELYNNCTFIVKSTLTIANIVMDSGSLTGGRISDKEWKPIPTVNILNNTKQELFNGSMIKATDFTSGDPCTIVGSTTEEASMIQTQKFVYKGTVTMQKNLILDRESEYYKETPLSEVKNPWMVKKDASVVTTAYGEAPKAIQNCSGTVYPGNEGDPDPEDPEKPDVEDKTIYTYAFEDQWPAYGDFDMNDIVVTINKMTITDSKKLTIQGNIRAVGSSRKTGVGIQFLNVSSSGATLSGKVQSGTPVFESGQSNPVVILSTNAHKYCNPSIADDDFTFYCTDLTAGNTYNSGDGATFEIAMTLSTDEEAKKAMNVKNLDVFIISKEAQGNVGRTEIHMANYAPTNLGTTALFGMGNDASADNTMLNVGKKGYYISTEGLAWGICIPGTEVWKWPKEHKIITNVYPGFKAWVTNGGKAEDLGWISNHTSDIFVKP